MRVIIDIDNVLADIMVPWVNQYNKDFNDSLHPDDLIEWSMVPFVKPEAAQAIYKYIEQPDLYTATEPIPYAVDGVHTLRQQGHQLVFATQKPKTREMAGVKSSWLHVWDMLWEDDVYVELDKLAGETLVGDIMIDDRPGNLESFSGYRILFAAPHNAVWAQESMPGPDFDFYYARNWPEVIQIVNKLSSIPPIHVNALTDVPSSTYWTNTDSGKPMGHETMEDVHSGRGVKLDTEKIQWSILPWAALAEVVKVMMFGANKYSRNNWAAGMPYLKMLDAAHRHINAYQAGVDIDPEDGIHHLAGAIFSLLCLISYDLAGMKEFDNRDKARALTPPDYTYRPS